VGQPIVGVLLQILPNECLAKDVSLGLGTWHHLQSQRPHLVDRAQSATNALGRRERVANVVCRVVVHDSQVNPCSGGQLDGAHVVVLVLPVEVPIVDLDQPLTGPVGEGGPAGELLSQVVGVGVDADHLYVDGERVAVLYRVGGLTGGDVDLAGTEHDVGDVVRRRRFGEVETDHRLDRLGLSRRLHVQLQDEVGAGAKRPGVAVASGIRQVARGPGEKIAVRLLGIAHVHAGESRFRIRRRLQTGREGLVRAHHRVMHDLWVFGSQLDSADVVRRAYGDRNHEIAKDVGPGGRQRVGLLQADDEIRFSQLPARAPLRRRRKVLGLPERRTALDPGSDESNFLP